MNRQSVLLVMNTCLTSYLISPPRPQANVRPPRYPMGLFAARLPGSRHGTNPLRAVPLRWHHPLVVQARSLLGVLSLQNRLAARSTKTSQKANSVRAFPAVLALAASCSAHLRCRQRQVSTAAKPPSVLFIEEPSRGHLTDRSFAAEPPSHFTLVYNT